MRKAAKMGDQDRIAKVFFNRTICITGASGFLGKVLVEKLLRCCEVKKIFLLVRTKKGKTPQQRLNDIFSNVVFNELKALKPTAISKCHIIAANLSEKNLGLSQEDRTILQNEVEFIFHSAASTRFDDPVKTAVQINTKPVKELLDLAEKCPKLKTFVHISTAYAFPKEKILYEKAYNPPDEPNKVLEMIEKASDEDIEKLLTDFPNTYTYSKALGEGLVLQRMDRVPAIIVRPSIVCPTWREPLKGWCNNLQGPMGLFVGAGKGIIRSMYMKSESYADFVPADCAINGMLVSVWSFLSDPQRQRFFNLVSAENNCTWEEMLDVGKKIIYEEVPFNGAVWYPGGSIKKSKFIHNVCFYLFQLLPAILIDALLFLLGYKPILYQIQRRIEKGADVFEYYTNKTWNFSHAKVQEIKDKLNDREKETYKIDGEGFNLHDYFVDCMWTVRRHILKEPDDTIARAKIHMKIMRVVDIATKLLMLALALYYVHKLITLVNIRY